MYDFLLQHGADPNAQDTFGNTVLHMMVISNLIVRSSLISRNRYLFHASMKCTFCVTSDQGMFAYAVKHHSKKALMSVENHQKLTPLTLASKLGRNEIFKEIIELQSIVSAGAFSQQKLVLIS